jgi:hypothetical protein
MNRGRDGSYPYRPVLRHSVSPFRRMPPCHVMGLSHDESTTSSFTPHLPPLLAAIAIGEIQANAWTTRILSL